MNNSTDSFNSSETNSTFNATAATPEGFGTANNIILPTVFIGAWGILLYLALGWNRQRKRREAVLHEKVAQSFLMSLPAHVEYDKLVKSLPPNKDPHQDKELHQQFSLALMNRAIADVQQTFTMREEKPALLKLLQEGLIEEEVWSQFLIKEKELALELEDLVHDADFLIPGWGQKILPEAHSIILRATAQHEAMQKNAAAIPKSPIAPDSPLSPLSGQLSPIKLDHDWSNAGGKIQIQLQRQPPAKPKT